MTTLHPGGIALLAGAAFIAAAVNAVAGGGSLLSFPALLLLGFTPLVANVSNSVGLLPGYAGGSAAYRPELHRQGRRMLVLGGVSALGAVAGALLLVRTAAAQFSAIVPWLILASCGLLAMQPLLARSLSRRRGRDELQRPGLLAGELLAGGYGAFFGAGLGVLTLAVLGLFLRDDVQRLNALKGVLSLIINAVAALCFLFIAPVAWNAVAVMLPSALAGGFAGVALARRLNGAVLRGLVVAIGVAVAVRMLV